MKQVNGVITWIKSFLDDDYQSKLVSGTNIKTVNNESLLGSGNITIGGSGSIDDTVTQNSSNPVKSSGIYSALSNKANTTHSHSISNVTSLQSTLNEKVEFDDLLDLIYPIGAIYISANPSDSICPIQALLGGTWERIQDRFLLASTDSQGVGTTGGEASVTLTANQSGIKSHTHTIYHTHNVGSERELVSHTKGKSINEKRVTVPTSGSNYAPSITSDDNWYGHSATGGASTNDSGGTTDTNAIEAHNNMPPFLMVSVWKRIPDPE